MSTTLADLANARSNLELGEHNVAALIRANGPGHWRAAQAVAWVKGQRVRVAELKAALEAEQ